MSGFKLLAIRPLDGCNPLFRKNLKEGVIYKFYQNYNFLDIDGQEIKEINNNLGKLVNKIRIDSETSNIYSNENEISISISAIVGENGSGKSSIIELFLYSLYWMSINNDNNLLVDPKESLLQEYALIESATQQFNFIVKEENETFLQTQGYSSLTHYIFTLSKDYQIFPKAQSIVNNRLTDEFKEYVNNSFNNKKSVISRKIDELIELEENLRKSFNVELVYEFNEEVHLFKANGLEFHSSYGKINNLKVNDFISTGEFPDLKQFFYTNLLNYSHHALNSKILGLWVNSLFHKNDAYKCPVVINPMRNEGNFKINQEETFAKERLLINLIHTDNQKKEFNFLGEEKNKFSNIILKIKQDIIVNPMNIDNRGWDEYFDGSMTTEKWIFEYFIRPIVDLTTEEKFKNIPHSFALVEYIIRKIYRLIQTYPDYADINPSIRANENPDYAEALKIHFDKDVSHTSFKIRRALNYLQQNTVTENQKYWKHEMDNNELSFDLESIKKVCGINDFDTILEINKKIPPSLFEVDIEFVQNYSSKEEIRDIKIDQILSGDKKEHVKKTYRFGKLSSGEKQFVFTWQSILYHLNNLESVHYLIDNSIRQPYQSINLILDEVELYMHPEYQRSFIKNLLEEIKSLQLNGIKSLNILFATHSPFILSDIPANNILHLRNGAPVENLLIRETFASNIHQLLANDFFLEHGYIGSFAQSKIQEVINLVNSETHSTSFQTIENALTLIDIIGEPVIKNKLRKLMREKFPFLGNPNESFEERIKLQEEIIEKLKLMQKIQTKSQNEDN